MVENGDKASDPAKVEPTNPAPLQRSRNLKGPTELLDLMGFISEATPSNILPQGQELDTYARSCGKNFVIPYAGYSQSPFSIKNDVRESRIEYESQLASAKKMWLTKVLPPSP